MSVADWPRGWASQAPDRIAVVCSDRALSYADLDARVNAVAGALARLGVGPGDRVALLELNSPDYLALVFACAHLGAILVPLNWRLAAPEHAYQLADSTPRALLAGEALLDHCESIEGVPGLEHRVSLGGPRDGWRPLEALVADAGGAAPTRAGTLDSPLLLVYTSGTTGLPKGALLSQRAVFWNAVISQQAHDLRADDVVLTNLPLFHVGGLNIQTLPALHAGARVLLHERFEAGRALADIESARPSVYLMVPATMQALVDHPRWAETDLGALRIAMAGSSTIPHSLLEAFFERGVTVGQIYGSTETCPVVVYLGAHDARRKLGSCGKPAVHCGARIARDDGTDAAPGERGEIVVRGPNLFDGYWRNQDATAAALEDGWFRTGDVGHVDDEGFFYVDDRKNDVIISGGENVYPAELENVLSGFEELKECAAVGRPDARWGEVPVAVVVPRDPDAFDPDRLLAALDGRLARYKLPREVIVREALPRNAMGKVLRYRLREELG